MSMPSMLGIFGVAVVFDMFEDMFGIFMESVLIAAMAEETAVIVMAVAIIMDSMESISRGQEEENRNEKNGGTGSCKDDCLSRLGWLYRGCTEKQTLRGKTKTKKRGREEDKEAGGLREKKKVHGFLPVLNLYNPCLFGT